MRPRRESLQGATAVLAVAVAGIHLYWGIPRFTAYASVGRMPDPRPLAFVLSGHAIMIAITLVAAGRLEVRRTYLPGIALMLVHLVGYAAWHTVLAHGAGPAAGSGHGHTHLTLWTGPGIVLGHLVNSPLALLAKTTELAVLVLLGVLYLDRRPA